MKKMTRVIAFIMAAIMVLNITPQQVNAADNITKSPVADSKTINNWHDANAFDDSTRNVGRIWTDKSVSTGDVELTGRQNESQSAIIKKSADSDFLVGLSTLSSTVGQTTVPLDIVLVLDVSGSMDDYDGSTGGKKRIDRLKEAVNDFIDSSAKENDKIADENKQSRIAVVKFAGALTDKVGNDTYRDSRFTYNYTQVVSGYRAYTSSDEAKLKEKVNALRPAGSTLANNAMIQAQKLVNQSETDEAANTNRKNVKRVVIFFTDGVPTSGNEFDEGVAESAIRSAKIIKDDGAYIYTIGIFAGADDGEPSNAESWSETEKVNAFMHGLSSNYPDADNYTYDKLGRRAKDSNGNDTTYYKAADASSLKDVFTQIGDEINSSSQSLTEVGQGGNPIQAGYLTITDQLGDYMQVDDINTLVYANKLFTGADKSETTENNKKIVTYTFNEDIPDTNHVYPEGNLKDIRITVEKAIGEDSLQTGDLVTVQIPANLIPLRYYEVSEDKKMTIDETYPMHLFYDVSLKAGAADKLKNPDAQMKTYINANKNENNQVYFYSNQYDKTRSGGESGGAGAYARFVPAATNDFYYFQNDAVLYTDEACNDPVKTDIDTSEAATYYYQRNYYELGDNGEAVSRSNIVTIPGNSNLLNGYAQQNTSTGEYYIPAGTPRTTSLSYFAEDKADRANVTETASQSIKPVWQNDNSVTTYLGNNGRLAVDVPDAPVTLTGDTALRGTKTLKGRDMKENEVFEFILTAGDDNTQTAIQDGAMTIAQNGDKAIVAGAEDGVTTEFQFGEVTFTKAGIYTFDIKENVPQTQAGGMTYDTHTAKATVTVERDTENFGKLKASISYNNGTAGTATDKAVFENSYSSSTEAEGGTSAEIKANNILNGRPLKAGEFQFKLATRPINGSNGTVIQEKRNQENGNISFDSLKYKTSNTAAGDTAIVLSQAVRDGYAVKSTDQNGNTVYTLNYRIYEETAEGYLPNGVSAVTNSYDFTVIVTDNGNGSLTAVTNYPEDKDKFEFVNQNGASKVQVEIIGSKTLAYEEGLAPDSITGKFTFTLEALTEEAPMPENTSVVNDATGNVNFGQIPFALSQLDNVAPDENGTRTKEFVYKVTESGNVSGVTNDTSASTGKTFKLTLHDDGEGILTVTRNPSDGPLFSFTNTYKVNKLATSITDQVKVNMSLTGRELRDGEFRFELLEGSRVIATGTNDADGTVTFDKITYTKPGNHLYTVRKVNQGESGITYDDQTYMIHTKITDNGDGTLKAEHQILAGIGKDNEMIPAEENAITFHNSYKTEPKSDTKPKSPASDAKDKVPETGDSSSIVLYLVLAVIAAMSEVLVVRRKKIINNK